MEWPRQVMDYFAPDSCHGDPETIRRAHLITGLAMLGGIFGISYIAFYLAIDHLWGVLIISICTTLMICVPFVMHATGKVGLSGHLHIVIWTIGFSALAAIEGGIHGHAIAWIASGVPLLAFLILERRAASIWCGLCFLIIIFFCSLELQRINLPLAYPEEWHQEVATAGYVGLAVFIALLGVIFEYSRHEALLLMKSAITERERTEQARLIAEGANRAKDQFLAILSHELRTPLTPILATVTGMDLQHLSPDLRTDIEMIHRNVELESKLIDDLLDLTRISRGKIVLNLETVDSHVCLRSVLEICQSDIKDKELNVSVELLAGQHYVKADPVRLRQVLWNLLSNAIKFTPTGGAIHILSGNDLEWLKVQVTDTGIGIAPEIMPRIFNAFEQGEQNRTRIFGGLGLGLSIAKAVVDMHHGRLIAFSEGTGKGATFTVELPTVPPLDESQELSLTREPENIPSFLKILLVEDDEETLRILSKLLQKSGHIVTSANGVQKGIELASKEQLDLIISDLGLPDGSGLELMKKIREHYKIPGIALSGYGTEEDIRKSLAAGFEEHLVKPINFSVLQTVIQRVATKHITTKS